jgi:hypothetical protein
MKSCLLVVGLLLYSISSFAQTDRPILVGIDVLKPALLLATPNRTLFRLAEATIKIPNASGRYLSLMAGYGECHSGVIYRNVKLDTYGYYVKIGTEPGKQLGFTASWNSLIGFVHEDGNYTFQGPTFGDYLAPIPARNRAVIGFEGILAHQFRLSESLLLRLSGRLTPALLIGPKEDKVNAYFIPGIGLVAGDPLVCGVGIGLHLFVKLPFQKKLTSQHD